MLLGMTLNLGIYGVLSSDLTGHVVGLFVKLTVYALIDVWTRIIQLE